MQINRLKNSSGYSLFELVMVMVIISILATVSLSNMSATVDQTKSEETKSELNEIAKAIVGNEKTTFGYVGDIGALPSSLQDLVVNPGLATWKGPYLHDDFYESSSSAESEVLIDSWGKSYSLTGSTALNSTGGSTTITKEIAQSSSDILENGLSVSIVDLANCPPGFDYKDSILVSYTYPNGSGSYHTDSKSPSQNGFVSFSSLPIGQHTLQVIELTNNDTLTQKVKIYPKSSTHLNIQIPISLWCSTAGLASEDTSSSGSSNIEILRPEASGYQINLLDENCSTNWQCVDETTADGEGTYVKGEGNGWNYDLYELTNSAVGSGTIDSVKVFIVAEGNNSNQRVMTKIRTNSLNVDGNSVKPPTSFTTYSTTYELNPQSGSAWSWSEIDALQAGAEIRREGKVTQVWVEVYYTN